MIFLGISNSENRKKIKTESDLKAWNWLCPMENGTRELSVIPDQVKTRRIPIKLHNFSICQMKKSTCYHSWLSFPALGNKEIILDSFEREIFLLFNKSFICQARSVRRQNKKAKKLGQYPAILALRLFNNSYIPQHENKVISHAKLSNAMFLPASSVTPRLVSGSLNTVYLTQPLSTCSRSSVIQLNMSNVIPRVFHQRSSVILMEEKCSQFGWRKDHVADTFIIRHGTISITATATAFHEQFCIDFLCSVHELQNSANR